MLRSPIPDLHIPASSAATGGGGSFRRILVPADWLGQAAGALAAAARLCAAVSGQVRVVHVRTWEPGGKGLGRFFFETSEEATTLLDQAVAGVWESGVRASGVVIEARRNREAAAIAAAATAWRADLIVMARRPRTALGVLLLGSPADQVMRAARCPVLAVREARR